MINEIIILFILFEIKHFLADFILQFPYMYKNKGQTKGWVGPLFDHAALHAIFTMAITMFVNPLWCIPLALLDLITHFIIDRWKATRKAEVTDERFWIYLGIDQMLHHIVMIIIIYLAIV